MRFLRFSDLALLTPRRGTQLFSLFAALLFGVVFAGGETALMAQTGSGAGASMGNRTGRTQTMHSAPVDARSFVLMGCTVHVGDGETVIENAAVGVIDGVFRLVADATLIRIDMSTYDTVVQLNGAHVYPGFIAAGSAIGLREVGAVRASADDREVGGFMPHVRSAIAFNTDSRVVATLRSNGVLTAQVTPQGGTISGTSSVMHLDGWNWEDALIREDDAIHLNWPGYFQRPSWWNPDAKVGKSESYDEDADAIRSYFEQARAYARTDSASLAASGQPINLAFEAMRGVFASGEGPATKKVFIRCRSAKEIAEVVAFAEGFELDYVLVDAHQAPEVADLLRRYNVPILLEQIHRRPPYAHSRVDYAYDLPNRLHAAGIDFAIGLGGGWDAFWASRNLVFHAGTAAAHGLSREAALAAVSGNVAEMLGVSDTYGQVAEGLQATFFVSEGDVLDMRSSKLSRAWIQGRPVDLDADPQKQLYRTYMDKYGLE